MSSERKDVKDEDLGYKFFEKDPESEMAVGIFEKITGIRVRTCGRKNMLKCYYVEGIEGDPNFEKGEECLC